MMLSGVVSSECEIVWNSTSVCRCCARDLATQATAIRALAATFSATR